MNSMNLFKKKKEKENPPSNTGGSLKYFMCTYRTEEGVRSTRVGVIGSYELNEVAAGK